MSTTRRLSRVLLEVSVVLALALGLHAAHAANVVGVARPSYFGSTEIENLRIAPFTKWTDMLARYHAEEVEDAGPCRPTPILPCFHRDWLKFLAGLKSRPVSEQLDTVNRAMNRHAYITDPVNWGVPDYWSAPDQFFRKDGDCEDYAIAKYMSLRQLGFDADSLRIVVLQDLNLGVPHAVLIVFVKGQAMLLDNQISDVVPASVVHHYKPIYSINEKAWWLHKG